MTNEHPPFPYGYHPARREDPEPSHIAAWEVVRSGSGEKQQDFCAAMVALFPGQTAKELDRHFGTDGVFHRRLSECRDQRKSVIDGPARPCTVTKRSAQTWYPPGKPPEPMPPIQPSLL